MENTGDGDLVYMEVFRADRFEEVSLSDWFTHSPIDMVADPEPRSVGHRLGLKLARHRSGLIEVKKCALYVLVACFLLSNKREPTPKKIDFVPGRFAWQRTVK